MRLGVMCALIIVLAAVSAPSASAETTTGTLIGRIIDTSGRPVADALVVLLNLRSGFLRGAVTDGNGVYRIPLLPPAEYRITATKEGYIAGHIERFQAEVGTTKEIIPPPIALHPARPGPLAPASASGSQARHQANVSDPTLRLHAIYDDLVATPLPGIRSYDALASLAAGVAPPPQTVGLSGPGLGPGVGTPGQFAVHGQRARSNNFTIDGADTNDQDVGVRRQGFTIGLPQPVEAVAAFELATALVDAETGRNSGAHVNAVSRAGGNDFHGGAYAYFTHDRFNARDFSDLGDGAGGNPAENPFRRFQGGGVLSGPLARSRAHFFGPARFSVVATEKSHTGVPVGV